MLIQQKTGNLNTVSAAGRQIDWLKLDWFETEKRILHKRTEGGREVVLKCLKEPQHLQQDDVLYGDEKCLIVVHIKSCEVIVLQPQSLLEMGNLCYEIGNKHLPLFYDKDELLIPYEAPLFRMLQAAGYRLSVEDRQLLYRMKTTVSPHPHNSESLFTKIIKLTTPASDAR